MDRRTRTNAGDVTIEEVGAANVEGSAPVQPRSDTMSAAERRAAAERYRATGQRPVETRGSTSRQPADEAPGALYVVATLAVVAAVAYVVAAILNRPVGPRNIGFVGMGALYRRLRYRSLTARSTGSSVGLGGCRVPGAWHRDVFGTNHVCSVVSSPMVRSLCQEPPRHLRVGGGLRLTV